MGTQLTKLEVARRQLVTAIRLFFDDADSVSVYTLAHAAWEILDALCRDRGAMRFYANMAEANDVPETKLKKIATYGRNFFKHADRDPEAVMNDFDDQFNEHVIIAATMDFGELANRKPIEVQVFQIWYFAAYPEKAPLPAFKDILEAGEIGFPGIKKMDRRGKKASGRELLLRSRNDHLLASDPSTDTADVGSL